MEARGRRLRAGVQNRPGGPVNDDTADAPVRRRNKEGTITG